MDPTCSQYIFHPLTNLKFHGLGLSSTVESLKKWSMFDGLKIAGFSFDKPYKPYLQAQFVQDFLANGQVRSKFEPCSGTIMSDGSSGNPADSGTITTGQGEHKIQFRPIACTKTCMSIFDKLCTDESILWVRKSGSSAGTIKKCLDQYFTPQNGGNSILVSNRLQKMLLKGDVDSGSGSDDEESDHGDDHDVSKSNYSEEKAEFLFKLFGHLVVGGAVCQYEDTVTPYLTVAKLLYKDLISVSSTSTTPEQSEEELRADKIHVNSIVVQITDGLVFAKPQINNFLYLIIDPGKRICYTLRHQVV